MGSSRAIAVVVATACAVGAFACTAETGSTMNAATAGTIAFAPTAGAGAFGGAGGAGIGGAAGFAGASGFGGAAGFAGASGFGGASGAGGAGVGGAGAGGSPSAGAGGTAGAGGSDPGVLPTGAIASLMGLGGQTVHGTAMFTQSGMDVALVITLADCMNGIYPVHIHDGTSCTDTTSQGMHWDGIRGEGIPAIVCDGGNGIQTHTRMAGVAEKTWSIGAAAADDVIGHVVVVHGASAPVACGVIMAR